MSIDTDIQLAASGVEIRTDVAKFGDTYYPIANIGAVTVSKKKVGYRFAGFIGVVLGVLISAFTLSAWWLILAALGLVMLFKRPDYEYSLILATSSGNKQAYMTRDRETFEHVRSALEAAISTRKAG